MSNHQILAWQTIRFRHGKPSDFGMSNHRILRDQRALESHRTLILTYICCANDMCISENHVFFYFCPYKERGT